MAGATFCRQKPPQPLMLPLSTTLRAPLLTSLRSPASRYAFCKRSLQTEVIVLHLHQA